VKQKPNVNNLSFNHSNESKNIKVQMCKKSATKSAKGLSNLEAYAKSTSRKVNTHVVIKK
jgi:hypothetical protein